MMNKKLCYQGQGQIQGGRSPPLKPTIVTLFTMIYYNLDSSISDIKPFCPPLFSHNSVVKNTYLFCNSEP